MEQVSGSKWGSGITDSNEAARSPGLEKKDRKKREE